MHPASAVYDDALKPRLVVGAVVSVLAHVALLTLIVTQGGGAGATPPRLLSPPEAELEPPPTPVGIEDSRAVSINWLGFADPTEHSARPAETDQAEMSPEAPGVPVAAEADAEPEEEAAPAEVVAEAAAEPAEAEEAEAGEPTEEPVEAEPVDVEPAVESPVEIEAADASDPAPSPLAVIEEASAATTERLFRVVRQAAATARALAAQAERKAAEQTSQESAAAPRAGESPDAIEAEKASDATSVTQVVDWSPGRPLAAQGLDIKTDRPRWATTTRLWAVPRNPVVQIEFRKNGTVAKAAFLPGRDTGYRDVDSPLLDAIYRWTASGTALEDLPAGEASARVTITMRVILIPERGEMRRSSPRD